ncbi:MAG: hypothetical protein SAL07_25490 [Oscillatoria sp. PMC 1051.18]|nr:hypothetical protein [Oscillatoria sp. PMC 1050.18]MEC5033262.1 hypothetical protein [Oscillatoria sp. PMC 1051.18]
MVIDDVAAKKDDPNFSQVAGHIPKELATKFRVKNAAQGLKVSDGLEKAIAVWVEEDIQPNQDGELALSCLKKVITGKMPSHPELIRLAAAIDYPDPSKLKKILAKLQELSTNGV